MLAEVLDRVFSGPQKSPRNHAIEPMTIAGLASGRRAAKQRASLSQNENASEKDTGAVASTFELVESASVAGSVVDIKELEELPASVTRLSSSRRADAHPQHRSTPCLYDRHPSHVEIGDQVADSRQCRIASTRSSRATPRKSHLGADMRELGPVKSKAAALGTFLRVLSHSNFARGSMKRLISRRWPGDPPRAGHA